MQLHFLQDTIRQHCHSKALTFFRSQAGQPLTLDVTGVGSGGHAAFGRVTLEAFNVEGDGEEDGKATLEATLLRSTVGSIVSKP